MTSEPWPAAAACVALLAIVAGFHVFRLTRRGHSTDVDLAHAAMAVVMLVMIDGGRFTGAWWSIAFLTCGVWFALRAARGYVLGGVWGLDRYVVAAISCAAMGVMLLAPAEMTPAMSTMAGTRSAWRGLVGAPLVGWVLIFALVLAAGRDAVALVRSRGERALGTSCRLAMSAVCAYLLALSI